MTIETFRAEQHGAGHGLLLRAAPSATLADLDPATTIRALASAGFLLFRGFHPDITEFSAFTRAHSDRITLDPARQFEGKVAQKVDAGTDAVGLHIENGNSPFAPDLTWFYCRTAASAGSQTTVCDGYRVWDELSPTARDAFAGQDIVYSRDVAAPAWKAFVRHHRGSTAPDESITVDDMRALATGPGRTTITEHDDGAIHYVYQVPAVHPTLFGERPSFANSILGPSYNYQKPLITFAENTARLAGSIFW